LVGKREQRKKIIVSYGFHEWKRKVIQVLGGKKNIYKRKTLVIRSEMRISIFIKSE